MTQNFIEKTAINYKSANPLIYQKSKNSLNHPFILSSCIMILLKLYRKTAIKYKSDNPKLRQNSEVKRFNKSKTKKLDPVLFPSYIMI